MNIVMTFLHATRIARAHGYSSCIFLPDDHLLYTQISTITALFASCEEERPVHCLTYRELAAMSDETLVSTLQPPVSVSETEAPKKRRRAPKEALV